MRYYAKKLGKYWEKYREWTGIQSIKRKEAVAFGQESITLERSVNSMRGKGWEGFYKHHQHRAGGYAAAVVTL